MDTVRKNIGEIAKELGLSQRAVRYYEELGFIKPTRTESGYRTYSARDVELLKIVISFKDLGMTLEDIHAIIVHGAESLDAEAIGQIRESLSERRKEFESKIEKYREGLKQIDRVLDILSGCNTCGKQVAKGICEECLKERTKDAPTIITPLLTHDGEDQ